MIETGAEIDAEHARVMGLAQEVVPGGTAVARATELAEHIAGYSQWGIRADRTAALAAFGMPLEDGLQLEMELCHDPALGPEAAAGMARFASGVRPEPPRAPVRA